MATATTVKERPILFKGPLVRAILEGRKTVTRRVVKPQPVKRWNLVHAASFCTGDHPRGQGCSGEVTLRCPYGQPGDRLWVREAFQPLFDDEHTSLAGTDYETGLGYRVRYPATDPIEEYYDFGRDCLTDACKPSIHMPRWASRITLEVTSVGVERIQEITTEQIEAEGLQLPCTQYGKPLLRITGKHLPGDYSDKYPEQWRLADYWRAYFAASWDDINAARGFNWKANPWVWVIEFKKLNAEG